MFEIRRIRPDDWERLREVRLAALLDEPSAFGSTYAAELEAPERLWVELAASRATGSHGANFLALDSSQLVVGIVGIFPMEAAPSVAELTSMWVAPAARRHGLGTLLVRGAVDWALSTGCSDVQLWVTRGNDPARSLYSDLGFVEMGDVRPLPSDPCQNEVRMRWNRSTRLDGDRATRE